MKRRCGHLILLVLGAVAATCLFSRLAAHPDGLSFAVNFASDEPSGARSDVTGEAGILQTQNWNNLDLAAGGPVLLVADNQGAAEPSDQVTVQWWSNNTWASTGRGEENNTAPAGNDRNLMTGYLDTTATSVTTVTVSGLSNLLQEGDTYTVYAYINGGVTGRGGDYAVGDQVQSVIDTAPFEGTYVLGENYIIFEDLSGDSFTLTATPTTGAVPRAPLNGIEVVLGSAPTPKVPLRTVTPQVSTDECPPGGLGPVTVKLSQILPEDASPDDPVTVTEQVAGPFDQSAVTAQNGGSVQNLYPTGLSGAGYINAWLVLGPYAQPGGAAPGPDAIRLDYLTDGDQIDEQTARPHAGDTVSTDYQIAASTGLLIEDPLNPDGVPTWNLFLDPSVDTIDLINDHYGGPANNSMAYAVTYVYAESDIAEVNLCVGSDDAVQVLLDGLEVHLNDVARGWGAGCQDEIPLVDGLEEGLHIVMVKVFQGGGGHGFRLGFFDSATGDPVQGISVCTDPDFDPHTKPCVWDPIGAEITWNTTRGQLVDGVTYRIAITEGTVSFTGTIGQERIQGSRSVTLFCDRRVANLTCTDTPPGGVALTWENHPYADTSVPIRILNNGAEVLTVPGTETSAEVSADDLSGGFNTLCVVNSSGQESCCTVVHNALILSDMVAGGDGTGTAQPHIVGIDPDTGWLQMDYLNAGLSNTGDNPQAVSDDQAPYVDAVFILDAVTAPGGEMPISSMGLDGPIYTFDPMDVTDTYGYILKDVTHDIDKGITDIWAGGDNTWTNCVAIHAAAGITFDLEQIRSDFGQVESFTCFAGADSCGAATISLYAITSDEDDILDAVVNNGDGAGVLANTGAPMELAIAPDARFLTLAVGAFDGEIGCDHGVFANAAITLTETVPGQTQFKRGDVNADGGVNIADAVSVLQHLFAGAGDPPCMKAADANDDGGVNIADAVSVLQHLFAGAGDLPPPFSACGTDTTEDQLTCDSFDPCKP